MPAGVDGNTMPQADALQSLHDLSVPASPAWVPQTAGWYVLFGVLAVGLAWLAVRRYRRWKANRYRGEALAGLESIKSRLHEPATRGAALAELPVLVKRTALSFDRRTNVASLYGEEWLRRLDSSYGGTGFSAGPGRRLIDAAYVPAEQLANLQADEVDPLVELVGLWIRKHHA